eukprot:1083767-Pelagomonas_calceolata.AAC.2
MDHELSGKVLFVSATARMGPQLPGRTWSCPISPGCNEQFPIKSTLPESSEHELPDKLLFTCATAEMRPHCLVACHACVGCMPGAAVPNFTWMQ